MTTKTKHTVEDLKDEINELKLTDIRKDINSLKDVVLTELNFIKKEQTDTKEHVKKTNGSVARVTEQAYRLEQLQKIHSEEDAKHWARLDEIDNGTKPIRWLMKKPKLIGLGILAILYSLTVPEIREFVAALIKKLI